MTERAPSNGALWALGAAALLSVAGRARKGSFLKRSEDGGGKFGMDLDLLLKEFDEPQHPKECQIWLLNADNVDGFYVSRMLREVFGISSGEAMRLGLTAHRAGRALVRVFPCEEAEAKVREADQLSAQEHPEAVGILDVVELDD